MIAERFLLCTVVKAEDTANRPRADEVTGFTRCSVLKVRVDTRDPRKEVLTSRRGRAGGETSSPSGGVNRSSALERLFPGAGQSVIPASRANRRRPTCHTEPDIAPGGFALDRQVLARLRLPIHADAALSLQPPRFRAAAHEPHRLQERGNMDAPHPVLLFPEDAHGHPDVRRVLRDPMLLVDRGRTAAPPPPRAQAAVVQVDDRPRHPSLLFVRVERAFSEPRRQREALSVRPRSVHKSSYFAIELVGDRHQLAEHVFGRFVDPDVVPEGLAHLLNAIQPSSKGIVSAICGSSACVLLELAADEQVEQLVGAPSSTSASTATESAP